MKDTQFYIILAVAIMTLFSLPSMSGIERQLKRIADALEKLAEREK